MLVDIFRSDAFSLTSLVAAIEQVPYVPQRLAELGLFEQVNSMTKMIAVEERTGTLSLIPLRARGAAPVDRTTEKRKMRPFTLGAIAMKDRVTVDELQDVREFGTEGQMMSMQSEVGRRLVGPTGLRRHVELTWEYMRLAAVQGKFLDPGDGSTVYDFSTEFGITPNDTVFFDLAAAAPDPGVLRGKCDAITRLIQRKAQAGYIPSMRVHALCSDSFWDGLMAHSEWREAVKSWPQALELRQGTAFSIAHFAGIDFENYRGTDDGSTVAIPDGEAKVFPVGIPGNFQVAWGPSEFEGDLGNPGRPETPIIIADRDRGAWIQFELYSYPLFYCTRPGTLVTADKDAP